MQTSDGSPLRVAVVEDVPLFRQLLAEVLESTGAMEVVAQVETCAAARTLLPALRPDVLLLDLHLPDGFGFDLGIELRRAIPGLRVIVLSEHVRPQVLTALGPEERPYWSYVLKTGISSREEFAGMVLAARNRTIVDSRIGEESAVRDVHMELLTDRQHAILALVAKGLSNAAIGEQLYMGTKTVEYHLTQIYAQLELLGDANGNSRVQAAVRYLDHEQGRP